MDMRVGSLPVPWKVDLAFDAEPLGGEVRGQKRKREESPATLDRARRQHAWLGAGKLPASSWRPRKLLRQSAKRWMDNLDLQFRVTNDLLGLVHFKRCDSAEWADPFLWPHLCVGMDLGSDGLAGYQFLERRELLNIDATPDVTHGGNRDVINMLHDCNIFQLWLLCVISMNLPFGPDKDEQRAAQLREALEHAVSSSTPASSPLFQAHAGEMIEELRLQGIDPDPNTPPEEFLWRFIQERPRKLHRRVAMNRFHASIEASVHHERNWLFDLFERSFLALETDFLHGRKLEERIALRIGAPESAGEGGGATRVHVQLEDRGLKRRRRTVS